MEKKEILEKFVRLTEKINLINEKVKSSSCCNGIFVKEYIKCWCEFGEIMSFLKDYYRRESVIDSKENESLYSSRFWLREEVATNCRYALSNLERNLGLTESDFLYEEKISDMYFDFTTCCCVGDYDTPNSYAISNLKKDVISDTLSIAYDMWSIMNGNSVATGINNEEIEKLHNEYFLYRGYVGSQIKSYVVDEKNGELILCYEGPQYGKEIEGVFEYIDNSYSIINDSPKKLQKK